MSSTLESSITTECSISLLTISQPAPMALNGPMKLSTTRVPAPMATGPRSVELTISAPASTTTRPSIVDAASTVPSSAGLDLLQQQPVGLQQRRQLAGVDPPAGEQLGAHPVAGVISHWMASVISSSPRAEGAIARTASWIVGSNRYTPTRARSDGGSSGFSTRRDDVAGGVEGGDAEAVRVGHLLEQDLRDRRLGRRPGRLEGVHERGEVLLEQVVAEVHDEVVVAEEVAGDQHAVGQAERGVLGDVRDRGPEPAAVTERRADLGAGVTGDHADLDDPGGDHRVDAVEQDRRVGHGHQLLGPRVGDRPQAGAGAAGQDQGLHRPRSVRRRRASPASAAWSVGGTAAGAGPTPRK